MKQGSLGIIIEWTLIIMVFMSITLFAVFPFYWLVTSSLKPSGEIFAAVPTLLPSEINLESYHELLQSGSAFRTGLRNSLIVASSTAILSCLIALLASYSLTTFQVRGQGVFSMLLFMTQMFPQAVILVPLFILFQNIGLYDTLPALILIDMAFAIPVAIWLLIGFLNGIPREIIEAARIDGASHFGTIFRIIIPISRNGLLATMMYIFVRVWGELLFAVTMTPSNENKTLPVVLSGFRGQNVVDYSGMLATAVLTALPVIIIFLFLQRFFASGLVSGSVKG